MCPDASLLSAFYDDEVPDPWKTRLEGHLAGCPACRATLEAFQHQSEILKADLLEIEPDERREDKFWNYVGHSRLGRTKKFPQLYVPAPLAAAAALLLVAAVVMNFLPLRGRTHREIIMVESRPMTPTVVSLTIAPQELDALFAMLEGVEVYDDEAIRRLPLELPVARYGEPQIVRNADLPEAP